MAFVRHKTRRSGNRGFTLIELLIVVAVSGIVVLGLARLYTTAVWSFGLQDHLTEMHQNAQYTVHRLAEELMQVGADLPDTNYTVLASSSSKRDSVAFAKNLSGYSYRFLAATATNGAGWIGIPDAAGFIGAHYLLRQRADATTSLHTILAIDTTNPDSLRLGAATTFATGDMIYPMTVKRFFRHNNNLCCDSASNVIAENIDSLAMIFYNASGTATTNWALMRAARVYVRTRTAVADRRYTHPVFNDGYRRVALNIDFSLKNRF